MSESIESLTSQIETLTSQVSELKKHEKQLELVIKSTGVGIWDWYVQTGETSFNERWANIIGYTLEEISPVSIDTWIKFAHPDDLKESDRLLKAHWAGKTEYYSFESRMKHKDGHWVWVFDTGQVIEWETIGVPKRMIGTHLDITDKKAYLAKLDEVNKKLQDLSYLDPLTKVPNRRAYEERLSSEVAAAKRAHQPLSLLMIDIDHFKQYNDTYGHDKGDEVLIKVAEILSEALPRETDFVARYGGEEFIAILPTTNLEGAVLTAQRLLERVTTENIEHSFSSSSRLTVSVGISSTMTEFDKLLKHADTALYAAKKNGRNRHEVFTS